VQYTNKWMDTKEAQHERGSRGPLLRMVKIAHAMPGDKDHDCRIRGRGTLEEDD